MPACTFNKTDQSVRFASFDNYGHKVGILHSGNKYSASAGQMPRRYVSSLKDNVFMFVLSRKVSF